MDRVIFREKREEISANNSIEIEGLLNNIPAKILFIVISGFLFYNVFHSVRITIQKLEILKQARLEVESLRLDNLELALNLENMQSLEYVEVQARDRLNFGSKNEYVFVIPEASLDEAKNNLDELFAENVSTEKKETYRVWLDFVSKGI
ncbi:hypothetical protein GYA44_03365 [Candidatus Microgenomates bacterium]|jgi:cell division protein FtsB|nr:hypothetical protein [Candidatus Microgenomates bacterium]